MTNSVSLFLLGVLTLFSCKGQKNTAYDQGTALTDLECYTKKVFPGVSGEIVYFVQYRVEFNLKTNTAVRFERLVTGGQEVPIQSVKQGSKIVNTHLGKHLDSDTDNVQINATLPMRQADIEKSDSENLIEPGQLTLVYQVNGEERTVTISDITNEPNEYRPAAPRGQD